MTTSEFEDGSKSSMLEQIPLSDVAQTLDLWWQDSTPKEAVAGRLTPDAIIDRARRAGCGVDIAPIRRWEDRTDEDLLAELLRCTGPLSGELLLVTEASFQASVGGFRLEASVLGSALKEHQERFEPVFNGDVILLSLEDRRIVCVHHENYLVRVTSPHVETEMTDEGAHRSDGVDPTAADQRHTVAREGELDADSLEELLVRAEKASGDEAEMDRIVEEIDGVMATYPGPQAWYAGAYVRYLHPARRKSVRMQTTVDELLRRTLGSLPAEYRAWLYLGHNRYDLGEHAAARGHFEEAARLAPMPDYLGLKAREMATCCSLIEHGVIGAIDELESYVTSAVLHPIEDIWPAELARVLRDKLAAPLPREMGDRLLVLARRLDAAGHFGDWLTDIVSKAKGDGG